MGIRITVSGAGKRRCPRRRLGGGGGGLKTPDREYKFQSRESAVVKKHNRLSILKCSDVLHYNKNVTRGLCVRGNIVGIVCAALASRTGPRHSYSSRKNSLWGENDFRP